MDIELADKNFYTAWMLNVDGFGAVLDRDQFCLTHWGAKDAVFNYAFVKTTVTDVDGFVDDIERFYGDRSYSYSLVSPQGRHTNIAQLADRLDLRRCDDVNGMLLSTPEYRAVSIIADLDIQAADTVEKIADFQRVAANAYDMHEKVIAVVLNTTFMMHENVFPFVGYIDSQPACTALVYFSDDMAGIYWVGTHGDFRCRGLGDAITWRVVEEAKRRNYSTITLQASAMGYPVYKKMGFVDMPYERYSL